MKNSFQPSCRYWAISPLQIRPITLPFQVSPPASFSQTTSVPTVFPCHRALKRQLRDLCFLFVNTAHLACIIQSQRERVLASCYLETKCLDAKWLGIFSLCQLVHLIQRSPGTGDVSRLHNIVFSAPGSKWISKAMRRPHLSVPFPTPWCSLGLEAITAFSCVIPP